MLKISTLPPIVGTEPFCNIERISVNGEVVLTTAQVSDFYGSTTDNIKKNFNANKSRFEEGAHYFKIEGDDLQEIKNKVTDSYLVGKNANVLYLWTRKGVLRHCKMLKTDKAWEVFDAMEDTYFKVLEMGGSYSFSNSYFPPELSERWLNEKTASALIQAAKLVDSRQVQQNILSEATIMLTGKDFFDSKKDEDDLIKL